MKNIKHTLKQMKTKDGLSPKERALLRSHLTEYRAYKPIRDERMLSDTRLPHVQPHTAGTPLFLNIKPMPLLIGLLIAGSVSGGTAFAAEGAVPGDILYPIKTEVNETVRGALALNAEAKAEFDAWRAERRLNETQQLAARSELSDEVKARLEANFEAHADRAEARIAIIEENDPALAASLATRFGASLVAHKAILAETDATTTASAQARIQAKIDSLLQVSSDAAVHALVEGETATITVDRQTAAKRMYAAAESALGKTKTLYTKIQSELDAETQTRVEAEIKKNTEVFANGAAYYDAAQYGEAFVAFQDVVRTMNHLSVFLRLEGTASEEEAVRPSIQIMPIQPRPIDVRIDAALKAEAQSTTDTQIDPPSLELDSGPEDTSVDTKTDSDVNTRLQVEVGI